MEHSFQRPLLRELVQQHFKQLSFLNLKTDPRKQLTTWLNDIKDAVLVCCSFGRPFLSEVFRKSFVSEVIFEHKLTVFIAHRKSYIFTARYKHQSQKNVGLELPYYL